jgi:hypothetical protein
MVESELMGRYQSSVRESDDESRIVFGTLDSEPVVMTDMRLGQELAIRRDHRRFTQQEGQRSSQ